MNITLNILPPEEKQDVRFRQFYMMIKDLIITILLIMIVSAIVLLLTKMSLQNHFNAIVEQTTLTTRVGELFNQDIKDFNQMLGNVETIQKEYTAWSLFIKQLSAVTPDGISYTNVRFNHDTAANKLLLTGVAVNRDQLLTLQQNLNKNPLFSNVVLPLESLLKRENIRFDIKADLQLEYLTNANVNQE